MSDPLNKSGDRVHTPVALSGAVNPDEVNQSGRKFNRSVSSVSSVKVSPRQGLRAKAKNFLPRPLYKFLVSLMPSGRLQYQWGKAISLASEENRKAWQELGQYHARPEEQQELSRIYELQLSCRTSDLKLDRLQGLGDSPVAVKTEEFIELLNQCMSDPDNSELKEAYETACFELGKVKHEYETLRFKKAQLKKEAESLSRTIKATEPMAFRLNLDSSIFSSGMLTDEERSILKKSADRGYKAYLRLTEVKKELSALEKKIRHYDNTQVDVERAREALFQYESIEKKRNKRLE